MAVVGQRLKSMGAAADGGVLGGGLERSDCRSEMEEANDVASTNGAKQLKLVEAQKVNVSKRCGIEAQLASGRRARETNN
jgi:hypothetical protein